MYGKDFTREKDMSENKRLEGIQVLRAIAFLEIFLGHCGVEWCAASFGVSIFVILSGFCMAINYLPKVNTMSLNPVQCVKFSVSKIKKLYPLHLMMLAIIYVIVRMPTSGQAIPRMIREILLVKCWTTHSEDYFSYNGVAWYLATYFYICMMAPYAIHLVAKVKNKKQVLTLGTGIYVLMLGVGLFFSKVTIPIGDGFAKWITYICPFYRMLDFTLGVLLGWVYLNCRNKAAENQKKNNLLEILALLAFIIMEYAYLPIKENYMGIGYNVYFVPASLLIVWVFAVNGGFITKILNNKLLLWIGNISGFTFLIHQVVLRGVKMYILDSSIGVAYLPLVIIYTFVITIVIMYFYLFLRKTTRKIISKA